MKIRNISEINLEELANVVGGSASAGCSCSNQNCSCTGNQVKSDINTQSKNVVTAVTDAMKNR